MTDAEGLRPLFLQRDPAHGAGDRGDRDSYQYLVESIRKFPDQETFAGMIRDAGFERVAYRNLSFGDRGAAFGLEDLR
jgi:ubiquinone/menaquinone biosynthesis C-methylase UbiE